MQLDLEKYLPYLDGLELPREKKEELLHILWRMMEVQADSAFGLNPVPLSYGQLHKGDSRDSADSVNLKGLPLSRCHGPAANENNHGNDDSATDNNERKNYATGQ